MSIKSGARLAQLRKQNGYSQESLAEKLGLSRQAISKWERGESSPDTDTLITLARLYGVSLDELVGHEPSSTAKNAPKENGEREKKTVRFKAKQKDPPLYPGVASGMLKFPFPVLIVALYILFGFSLHLWHPMWLLFLTIPVYYQAAIAANATTKKAFLMGQPIVMLSVILFLILGFALHAWKWAWILFILDIFYYWYVGTRD